MATSPGAPSGHFDLSHLALRLLTVGRIEDFNNRIAALNSTMVI